VSLRTKWIWIALLAVFGIWITAGNFIPEEQRKATRLWLDDTVMRLGLDLRGGIHIVIGPDLEAAIRQRLGATQNRLEARFSEDKISGVLFDLQPGRLVVKPPSAPASESVQRILEEPEFDTLEVEAEGDYALAVTFTDAWRQQVREEAIEQAIDVLRRRIDDPETGILESTVTRKGTDKILVEIPGMSRVPDIFRQTGHLEFKIVRDIAPSEELLRRKYPDGLPAGTTIVVEREPRSEQDAARSGRGEPDERKVIAAYLVPEVADMQGAQLQDASVGFGQTRAEWVVRFVWDADGGRQFGALTEKNVGRQLAIVIDGEVVSAPTVQSRIGREGQITGNFNADAASDLAIVLRSGALPIPTRIEEERTIGPALGADSIRSGVRASLLGLALGVVFLVAYYRRAGLYASAALALNMVLVVALMSLFDGTLTLPGIAGLVLTIATAVDGNVIVFERIREELRLGKTPRTAISTGFDKVLWTILDANITNMIAGIVLYAYGTGPIKGFAVTLLVGIVTSVFSVLVVTKALFEWKPGNRPVSELSI
jgi:protein-export membrane protein SecD